MASKGQKFNKYANELKEQILDEHFNQNLSAGFLSKKYEISIKTIETWIRKRNHPELVSGLKQGRPRKDELIDYKERYEILKKYQAFLKAQRERK